MGNGRSHKTKNKITEIAEEMDEVFLGLTYSFEVRWASSHFSVLDKIRKSYSALCHGLEAISKDSNFSAKQRAKALELLNGLKDRRFVLHLNFRLDLLNQLKQHSLLFQRRGGPHIQQVPGQK